VTAEALFEPTDSGFLARPHTDGPWAEGSLHGGPVAALCVHLAEADAPAADWRSTSLSLHLLRPVTRRAPLVSEVRLVRAGRRIRIVEADLLSDGTLVARASLLRMARLSGIVDDTDPSVVTDAPPPDQPSDLVAVTSSGIERPSFMAAIELRTAGGDFAMSAGWFRLAADIVPGAPPSPMGRAAAFADFGNGISSPAHIGWPPRRSFVNADLQVSLHRDPVGEWIRVESQQRWSTDATGVATSRLSDQKGNIGDSRQHLVIA
jgi:acyl-CoA thioesterase